MQRDERMTQKLAISYANNPRLWSISAIDDYIPNHLIFLGYCEKQKLAKNGKAPIFRRGKNRWVIEGWIFKNNGTIKAKIKHLSNESDFDFGDEYVECEAIND